MTPAIQLLDVEKRYGKGESAYHAVRGVSFSIANGEMAAIMGPSGSGKSTLLNLVAGLVKPTCGKVLISGADVSSMTDAESSHLRLKNIGFVFQSFNLLPTFNVEENVAWPAEFLGFRRREARERARAMLFRVGLEARIATKFPPQLSGGEQQRVAIARAIVTNPSLLIADEPTGNLDSSNGAVILNILRSMRDETGMTLVLVTHSLEAAQMCERLLTIRDGRIVEDSMQG